MKLVVFAPAWGPTPPSGGSDVYMGTLVNAWLAAGGEANVR